MRDAELAISEMEVNIENERLNVLVLHQYVAIDLRCIIVVLKANNDLDRMGYRATNVLERIEAVKNLPPIDQDLNFHESGKLVKIMVKSCLDALVRLDGNLAKKVRGMDNLQ